MLGRLDTPTNGQQVFGEEYADDVARVPSPDGYTAVGPLPHLVDGIFGGGIFRDAKNLVPWAHDIAHGKVSKVEYVVNQGPLLSLHDAFAVSLKAAFAPTAVRWSQRSIWLLPLPVWCGWGRGCIAWSRLVAALKIKVSRTSAHNGRTYGCRIDKKRTLKVASLHSGRAARAT